jgi:hypothetical protein
MPAVNVGTSLPTTRTLLDVLVPRFVVHFADWLAAQEASGSDAHEALHYLQKLDPTETAKDTVNFVMRYSRPRFGVTPVIEVADLLGGLSLAITEGYQLPDDEFKRLSRELGAVLITMLADATGFIAVQGDGTEFGVFMFNPEEAQRVTWSRPARRAESWDDDGSPRTQRMLRALRDMRELRQRRKLRAVGY